MALKTSSNGKVLYIYQAGNTIDLYEAETYQYLRTITPTRHDVGSVRAPTPPGASFQQRRPVGLQDAPA